MTPLIPVLMYHSVAADPPAATHALSVHPRVFAAQLAMLRDGGFTGLTFGQIGALRRASAPLPPRPVVLTFDDGYADAHEQALPALLEYGFPASVFVTSGWVRDAGAFAAGRPLARTLSWQQVAELAGSGVEIGAHSHSHPQLDQLTDRRLCTELSLSKDVLEQRLGRAVPSMAYPFGYSSVRVRRAVAAAGYGQAAAVGNRAAGPADDVFAFPRLTIRRSTSPATFATLLIGAGLGRVYAVDRMLTRGWSGIRRTRSLLAGVRNG